MHEGVSAPLCCAFIHRVAFEEVSRHRVLMKSVQGNHSLLACGTTREHRPEKPAGSTYSSTSGLSPLKNSRGKWGFIPLHKTRPDSPVPTLQGLCDPNQTSASEVTRGTLRFLPPLEIRTSSIARNPVESRETRPSSTVSLTSQRHPEKLPEVTSTIRVNPGFTAATIERTQESFFNAF